MIQTIKHIISKSSTLSLFTNVQKNLFIGITVLQLLASSCLGSHSSSTRSRSLGVLFGNVSTSSIKDGLPHLLFCFPLEPSHPRPKQWPASERGTLLGSPFLPLVPPALASCLALSVKTLSQVSPFAKLTTHAPPLFPSPTKELFFFNFPICFPGNLSHTPHQLPHPKIKFLLTIP